jgi:hypothetical protein
MAFAVDVMDTIREEPMEPRTVEDVETAETRNGTRHWALVLSRILRDGDDTLWVANYLRSHNLHRHYCDPAWFGPLQTPEEWDRMRVAFIAHFWENSPLHGEKLASATWNIYMEYFPFLVCDAFAIVNCDECRRRSSDVHNH